MAATGISEAKFKVYLTFANEDLHFAHELAEALGDDARFAVSIDRSQDDGDADTQARQAGMIAGADPMVFVLSPDSTQSPACKQQIETAGTMSKRVLPVVAKPLGNIATPVKLTAFNHVRFDRGRSFTESLRELSNILLKNIEWIREHTRLLLLARSWDEAGRPENNLLNIADIAAAKSWTLDRPDQAPKPTDLHLDFIVASEAVARHDAIAPVVPDVDEDEEAEDDDEEPVPQRQTGKPKTRTRKKRKAAKPAKPPYWRSAARAYDALIGVALVCLLIGAGWYALMQQHSSSGKEVLLDQSIKRADAQQVVAETATAALERQALELKTATAAASQSLCKELVRVAQLLSTSVDTIAWDGAFAAFWALNDGAVPVLTALPSRPEASDVVGAANEFAAALGSRTTAATARADGLPRDDLAAAASGLVTACARATAAQ